MRRTTTARVTVMMSVVALVAVVGIATSGSSRAQQAAARFGQSTVQLATWNVCNHTCADWGRRLRAFARTVAATRPDVLAVQEVDTRDGYLARTARALRPLGYVPADPAISATCPGGCESHLFVKDSRFRVVPRQSGIVPTRQIPARTNPVAFALLADRASGAQLLAMSLHLEKQAGTGLRGADDRARNATVDALARWAQTSNAGPVPTVIMGDFNSYERKQADGPHRVLQVLGYENAENARSTSGDRYATINKTPADARWNGFPPRPRRFLLGGPRIDAILAKGLPRALRHQVYVRTRPDGRFDERFRASDHNMVRAWFELSP